MDTLYPFWAHLISAQRDLAGNDIPVGTRVKILAMIDSHIPGGAYYLAERVQAPEIFGTDIDGVAPEAQNASR